MPSGHVLDFTPNDGFPQPQLEDRKLRSSKVKEEKNNDKIMTRLPSGKLT